VIGLGTAPLGGLFEPVDDETAEATVDRAWDRGIRFFDTAPLYGHGLAERRLGQALARRPRDEFVLSTKVGRLLRADAPPAPDDAQWRDAPPLHPVFDFSHDGALRSFEESLERLGLDRVDIVLIHDPDDHLDEALTGAYRALARLRDEGVVRAIGAGMNHVEPLLRLAREGDFDRFLVAGRYTLLDRSAEAELLPLCLERRRRLQQRHPRGRVDVRLPARAAGARRARAAASGRVRAPRRAAPRRRAPVPAPAPGGEGGARRRALARRGRRGRGRRGRARPGRALGRAQLTRAPADGATTSARPSRSVASR
jgi:aryl-alcohol dehydrogenase-like predicted oxidoreductase